VRKITPSHSQVPRSRQPVRARMEFIPRGWRPWTWTRSSGSDGGPTESLKNCQTIIEDVQQEVVTCIENLCLCGSSNAVRPLTEEELAERIEAPDVSYEFPLGFTGVSLRFAWLSMRGHYPDEMDKPNQDAYKVVPSLGGSPDRFLLAVFDGHGEYGDESSEFVRDRIEDTLINLCARYPNDLLTAYKMTFLQLNQRLALSDINVNLSGTTACVALFDGQAVHVANVGDSRAVMGVRDADRPGRLKAVALSNDQTPFRADERQRIRSAGGLVMSFEQLMGDAPMHDDWDVDLGNELDHSGDPPRVWESDSQAPGCAFTRSIGDTLGEHLGVIAEPEILSRKLTDADQVIVVASDGVWEFLSNQAVVDLLICYLSPLDACRAVVAEAYRLWLQFDIRSDDITVVISHIDSTKTLIDKLRR
jgi:serine/threonine protein phosphatase PrpC